MNKRILKFIVDGQTMQKEASCNFTNIIRGSQGYLHASFSFRSGFDGCEKMVVFKANEIEVPVHLKGCECLIPNEVLKGKLFKLYVVGLGKNYRIQTNQVEVVQYD